ncbi:hypothetical protein NDU88_002303 [Pleurodeles waltl]|uniref:GIY-YIG domain-containing protein n=1 Tax=Pleurodeles waltl TaxID=8319 RepID=A0AAV7W3N7_PLEWA|nr:hypothetical protein NDU88_002303 [Pleurodeles waltl]
MSRYRSAGMTCNSGSILPESRVECVEVSVFPFVVCFRRVLIGGAPAPEKVADWWVVIGWAAWLLAGTAALFVCTAVAGGVLIRRAVLAVPARVRIAYFRPPACWRLGRRFITDRQGQNEGLCLDTKTFKYKHMSVTHKEHTNCNSMNVIHVIKCPCDLLYVGQTRQKKKVRILQHCSRIRCKVQGAPLVDHFITLNHSADSMRWLVIVKISMNRRGGDIVDILNLRECKWIHVLDSVSQGLNEYEEIARQTGGLSID